jgi:uncharacterized repeat protein (TIGR01451 family)
MLLALPRLAAAVNNEGTPQSFFHRYRVFGDAIRTGNVLILPGGGTGTVVNQVPLASSSATVSGVPADAQVQAAFLFWSASLKNDEATWPGPTMPDDTADLRTPDGALHGSILGSCAAELTTDDGHFYYCTADVTSILAGLGTANGTYTVSGVDYDYGHVLFAGSSACDPNDPHCQAKYANWSLLIVYAARSIGTQRDIILYNGYTHFDEEILPGGVFSPGVGPPTPIQVPPDGFQIPNPPNVQIAYYAMEGDPQLGVPPQGVECPTCFDSFYFYSGGAQHPLGGAGTPNAVGNVMDSQPSPGALGGLDLDEFDVSSFVSPGTVPPGSMSPFQFQPRSGDGILTMDDANFGGGESFFIGWVLFKVNRLAPNFANAQTQKTVDPAQAGAGETLFYNINLTNNGAVAATSVQLTDALPTGESLVPGSVRLDGAACNPPQCSFAGGVLTVNLGQVPAAPQAGSNRSVSFRAVLAGGLPQGQQICNSANLTFAETQGADTIGPACITVQAPALDTPQKRVVDLGPGAVPQPADTLQFTITIPKSSSPAANGISLRDDLPPFLRMIPASVVAPPGAQVTAQSTGGGSGTGFLQVDQITIPANAPSVSVTFSARLFSEAEFNGAGVPSDQINGRQVCNQGAVSASFLPAPLSTDDPTTAATPDPTCVRLLFAPHLGGAKSSSPASGEVVPGQRIDYTVDLSNSGNRNQTLTLTDDLPPAVTGFAIDQTPTSTTPVSTVFQPPPAGAHGTGRLVLSNLTMVPGAQTQLRFHVLVDPNAADATVIQNAVAVTVAEDPTQNTTFTSGALTVRARPDLSTMTKSVANLGGGTVFRPGDAIRYTLIIPNTGNRDATSLVVRDAIDLSLVQVVPDAGGSFDAGSRTVTWNVGTLAVGQTVTLHIDARVATPLASGTVVSNQAFATATQIPAPGTPSDDPATAALDDPTRFTVTSAPDFSAMTKAVADVTRPGGPVRPGDLLRYTINLRNDGTAVATNSRVVDVVDANLTAVTVVAGTGTFDVGTRTLTWTLGPMAPGDSAMLVFTAQVVTPLVNGTVIANQAFAQADQIPAPGTPSDDPATPAVDDPTRVTVVSQADLAGSTKTVLDENGGAAQPGDFLTYTITLHNGGDAPARQVTVTDVVDPNLTMVTPQDGGSFNPATRTITWPVATPVVPGTDQTLHFRARLTVPLADGTNVCNSARISSADLAAPVVTAPVCLTVVSRPDLVTSTKTVVNGNGSALFQPGDTVRYIITAINSGTAPATAVVVRDVVDANLTGVAVQDGGAFDPASRTVTWTVPQLGAQAQAPLHFTAQIVRPLDNGTVISDQALLSSAEITPPVPTDDPTTPAPHDPTRFVVTSAPDFRTSTKNVVDANGGMVQPGDLLHYTLTIVNSGGSLARSGVVTDVVSPNLTGVVVQDGGTFDAASRTITWTLPSPLALTTPVTLRFDALVVTPLDGGTQICNQGQIRSTELPAGQPTDDPRTAAAGDPTCVTVSSQAAFAPTKTVVDENGAPARPGDVLTWTISFTNTGTAVARNVVVTDPIDPGLTAIVPGQGGQLLGGVLTWNSTTTPALAAVAPGASVVLSFGSALRRPLDNGTVVANQATVAADGLATPVPTDDPTTPAPRDPTRVVVVSASDLDGSQKTVLDENGAPARPGDFLTWQITLLNRGDAVARNVSVSDVVDPNLTAIAPLDGGTFDAATRTVRWTVPQVDITPAQLTLRFRAQIVRPLASGTVISNQASILSGSTTVLTDDPATPAPHDPTRITVVSAPDLSTSTKSVVGDTGGQVGPGQVVTYTIRVHNSGDALATGVVVSDPVDPNLDQVTPLDGGVFDPAARTITWMVAQVPLTEEVLVHFSARVVPGAPDGAIIANQGHLRAAGLPAEVLTNRVELRVSAQVRLEFTKTVTDARGLPPGPGDFLTWTLGVRNTGLAFAFDVVVTDPVDTAHLDDIVPQNGGTLAGGVITWRIPQLAAGEQTTLAFTSRIHTPTPNGTRIANQGQLAARGLVQPLLSDDPSTPAPADPTVITVVALAQLAAQKTVVDVEGGADLPGDTLQYTIRVVNTGTLPTESATLTDPIPPLTSLVAGSVRQNGAAQPDGALSAGLALASPGAPAGVVRVGDSEATTVVFRVRIDATATPGALIGNQAFLQAQNAPLTPSDDPRTPEPNDPTVVVVGGGGALIAQKIYDPQPVGDNGNGLFDVGEQIQYQIRLTNVGQHALTAVRLDDPLPPNVSYTAGTLRLGGLSLTDAADGDAGEVTGGAVHVRAGSLAAGQTAVVAFRVRIGGGTQVVNQGTADAREIAATPTDADGNPANGYQPTVTPVGASAPVSVDKTAFDVNGGTLAPGDVVLYTVAIHNVSASPQPVQLADSLPAGTNFVAGSGTAPVGATFSETPGGTNGRGRVTVTGLTLPAGGDALVSFRVSLDNNLPLGQSICNQATAASGGMDVVSDPACLLVGTGAGLGGVIGHVFQDVVKDGQLRPADGDIPLAGFEVQALPVADPNGVPVGRAKVQDDGSYGLFGLPPGQYVLRALSPSGTQFAAVSGVESRAGASTTRDLLVDPSGRVYVSTRGDLVGGALVTLYYDDADPAAGGRSDVLVPAEQMGLGQQRQRTTSLGMYRFDAPAGHTYRLAVEPPLAYQFPSTNLPPQDGVADPGPVVPDAIPDPRRAGANLKYFLKFRLRGPADAVTNNHVPVDSSSDFIRIEKRADRARASVGELVTYTIVVQNGSVRDLPGLEVEDVLPQGLVFVRGSAHLATVNPNVATAPPRALEPAARGPLALGPFDLKSGGTATLVYQAVVGLDAREGIYENLARLVVPGLLAQTGTLEARARVRVVNDPIFDQGLLFGRVFCDRDGDGRPGPNEEGVFGARIYLDTGWYAVTDEDGKYHLKDIPPGVHLAKLDAATLPAGSSLGGDDSHIIWFTRGLPAKAHFAVRCANVEVGPDEVQRKGGGAAAGKPGRPVVRVAADLSRWTLELDGRPVPLLTPRAEASSAALAIPGPLTWKLASEGPPAASWTLTVWRWTPATGARTPVRELSGEGPPPAELPWDGKELEPGALYLYQLDVVASDGAQGSSPLAVLAVGGSAGTGEEKTERIPAAGLFDSAGKLTPRGQAAVAALARRIPAGSALRIEAHTDPRGGTVRAMAITSTMGHSVKQALVAAGLRAEQVTVRALGASRPLRPNSGPAARVKNRRIEVQVGPAPAPPPVAPPPPATPPGVKVGPVPLLVTGGRASGAVPLPADGRAVVELSGADGRRALVPIERGAHPPQAVAAPPGALLVEGELDRRRANLYGRPLLLDLLGVELTIGGVPAGDVPDRKLFEGRLTEPLHLVLAQPLAHPARWALIVRRDDGEMVWRRGGEGAPPSSWVFDAAPADPSAPVLAAGRSYRVQLMVEDGQGGRGSSPERSFTVMRTTAFDRSLGGGLFTARGTPTPRLRSFLASAAGALPKGSVPVALRVLLAPGRGPLAPRRVAAAVRAADLRKVLAGAGVAVGRISASGALGEKGAVSDTVRISAASATAKLAEGSAEPRVLIGGRPVPVRPDGRFGTRVDAVPGAPVLLDVTDGAGHRASYIVQPPVRLAATSAHPVRDGQVQYAAAGPAVAGPAATAGPPRAANLHLALPPRGLVQRSPQLALRGHTDPKNVVTINGRAVKVHPDGSFAELLPLPYGRSTVEIRSVDPEGNTALVRYPVEVKDTSFFLLALVDGAVSTAWDGNGKLDPDAARLDGMTDDTTVSNDELVLHGRAALYLKARVRGGALSRYLDITAHADTAKRSEFEDFLSQVVDPARFYPIYGDAATEVQDVRARDKLYVLVETDDKKARLRIGNFRSQLKGLELLNYDRALYGGEIDVARRLTPKAESHVTAFVSQDDGHLAKDHNVFRATGGSIYFLRHSQLVPGGEQVRVVVHDRDSGLPLYEQPMTRDTDYVVDYQGGRLLLKAPLPSYADASFLVGNPAASVAALSGHPVYLEVDYDYQSDGLMTGTVWGAHLSQRLFDVLTIGGGYVGEGREGTDYTLWGLEGELKLGARSSLRGEFARSHSTDAGNFLSQDGGLSFYGLNGVCGTIRGCDPNAGDHDAFKVELTVVPSDWTRKLREDALRAHGYVQVLDRGFFSSGTILEQGRTKYGGEVAWQIAGEHRLVLRHDGSILEMPQYSSTFPQPGFATPAEGADTSGLAKMETELVTLQYSGGHRRWSWKGEYAHQYERLQAPFTDGSLRLSPGLDRDFVAAQAAYRATSRWTLRAGQEVVVRTSGTRDPQIGAFDDHRFATTSLGADYKLSQNLTASATGAVRWNGDSAVTVGLKTKLSETATVYTNERLESVETGSVLTSIVGAEDRFGEAQAGRTYGEYQLSTGASGQMNRALLGLTHKWLVSSGISVNGGYEHQQTFGAHLPDGTPIGDQQRDVLSLGYEVLRSDKWRLAGRFEMRFDDMAPVAGTPCNQPGRGGDPNADPRYSPCTQAQGAAGALGAGATGITGGSGPQSGLLADRTVLPGGPLLLGPGRKIEWFTTQTGEWQWHRDLTFLGRFTLLQVDDRTQDRLEARLVELTSGLAYRPLQLDWFNLIFKYTKLLELRPTGLGQGLHSDSHSDVVSLIPIFELPLRLQLVEKVAFRHIDQTDDVAFDPLDPTVVGRLHAQTDLLLWINRVNLHLSRRVDAGVEYRVLKLWLPADGEQVRHGALLEVNYLVQQMVRLGVGFNFSRFGDNELADPTRDAFGFFVRVVGRY